MSLKNLLSPGATVPASLLAVALAIGCVHSATQQKPTSTTVEDATTEKAVQEDDEVPLSGGSTLQTAGSATEDQVEAVPEATSSEVGLLESENGQTHAFQDDAAMLRRAHLAKLTSPEGILEIAEVIEDGIDDESSELEEPEDAAEDGDFFALGDGVCGENGEHPIEATAVRPGVRYTADIEDDELAKLWKESPEQLGALSIGLPSIGRVVNAKPFPKSDAWTIVSPARTYGTEETIAYVTAAIAEVSREFPEGSLIRINDIGMPNGGYLQPHQSHQAGRDVDLSFYYGTNGPDRGPWAVTHNFDLDRNWALIKAFITQTDVQLILVDRSIIQRLRTFAEKKGEDKAWLDSIFNGGNRALIRHANGHKDHFHVRLYNPRAQELGRRVLPMMPKDPEQNVRYHKVTTGDTLGKIAFSFGSTVRAIQEANKLKGTLIRLGETLAVPMRGPCVHCPLPPEVIIPPRRLPPEPDKPLLAQTDRTLVSTSDESPMNFPFIRDVHPQTTRDISVLDATDHLMTWADFDSGVSF